VLTLTFSETVDASSFQHASLNLQANMASGDSIALSSATVSTADATIITVTFQKATLDALKLLFPLASSKITTHLYFGSSLVKDTFGNLVEEVLSSGAKLAENYIQDSTPPVLVSYNLDMEIKELTLSFSEPVRGSSIDVSAFVIQSSASASPSLTGTIATSTAPSNNGLVLTISLSVADVNAIKYQVNLASLKANTWLSFTTAAFDDMTGLEPVAISPVNAINVDGYTPDATGPSITYFKLDMNLFRITLSFNEPVNTGTINFAKFVVSNGAGSTVALTSGSVFASTQLSVTLNIVVGDADQIQLREVSPSHLYLLVLSLF
jgi:hypothetical protein